MEQDYLIAGHRIRVEGDRLVQTSSSVGIWKLAVSSSSSPAS